MSDELSVYAKYHHMWNLSDCLQDTVTTQIVPQFSNDTDDIHNSPYSLQSFIPRHIPLMKDSDALSKQFDFTGLGKTNKSQYNGHPIVSISKLSRQPVAIQYTNRKGIYFKLQQIKINPMCTGYYIDTIQCHFSYGEAVFNLISSYDFVRLIIDYIKSNYNEIVHNKTLLFDVSKYIDLTHFIPDKIFYSHFGIQTSNKSKPQNLTTEILLNESYVTDDNLAWFTEHNIPFSFRLFDFYNVKDVLLDAFDIMWDKQLFTYLLSMLEDNTISSIVKDNTNKAEVLDLSLFQNLKWGLFFKPRSIIESKISILSVINQTLNLVCDIGYDIVQGVDYNYCLLSNPLTRGRSILNLLYHNLVQILSGHNVTLQDAQYTIGTDRGSLNSISSVYQSSPNIKKKGCTSKLWQSNVSCVEDGVYKANDNTLFNLYNFFKDTPINSIFLSLQRATLLPIDTLQHNYIPCLVALDSPVYFYSHRQVLNKIVKLLKLNLGLNGFNYLPSLYKNIKDAVRVEGFQPRNYLSSILKKDINFIDVVEYYQLPKQASRKLLVRTSPMFSIANISHFNTMLPDNINLNRYTETYNAFFPVNDFTTPTKVDDFNIFISYPVKVNADIVDGNHIKEFGELGVPILSFTSEVESISKTYQDLSWDIFDTYKQFDTPILELAVVSFAGFDVDSIKCIIPDFLYDLTDCVELDFTDYNIHERTVDDCLDIDYSRLQSLFPMNFNQLFNFQLRKSYHQFQSMKEVFNKYYDTSNPNALSDYMKLLNRSISYTKESLDVIEPTTTQVYNSDDLSYRFDVELLQKILTAKDSTLIHHLTVDSISIEPKSFRSLDYEVKTYQGGNYIIRDDLIKRYLANLDRHDYLDIPIKAQLGSTYISFSNADHVPTYFDLAPCKRSYIGDKFNFYMQDDISDLVWNTFDDKQRAFEFAKSQINKSKTTTHYPIVRVREYPTYIYIGTADKHFVLDTGELVTAYTYEISIRNILSDYIISKENSNGEK